MFTQPLLEKIFSDSEGHIEFDIKHCLRSRFNKNGCMRCLQVCRSGALELQGRQIIFNAEKCTSCMLCAAVCPNDAFVDSIDIPVLLHVLASKREAVVFSCEKGMGSDSRILIPCVGYFSEPLLAAVNTVVKKHCFIDISNCRECVNSHCLEALQMNMQNLMYRIKSTGEIRLGYSSDNQFDPAADRRHDRRSFLRMIRKTLTDMGKEAVSFQFPDSSETENSERKDQKRNLAALQYALSHASDSRMSEKETLRSYFFSVSANDACDCCPLCTGMCPTGALKRKKEKSVKKLTFTSSHCSGCGLCVEFCRKDALTLERGFAGELGGSVRIK